MYDAKSSIILIIVVMVLIGLGTLAVDFLDKETEQTKQEIEDIRATKMNQSEKLNDTHMEAGEIVEEDVSDEESKVTIDSDNMTINIEISNIEDIENFNIGDLLKDVDFGRE